MAATMNYLSHKKILLLLPSALGLCLVYLANGHGAGPIISHLLPHNIIHALHCGTWIHRLTNIFGCILLLTSNYISHQIAHHNNNQQQKQRQQSCGPNCGCYW